MAKHQTPEPDADDLTEIDEPTEPEAGRAPAQGPPGMVQLTAEEHNRLQAEARAAKKRAKKLEEEKAERERVERQKAAQAAGDFDAALREEQAERERLRRTLQERDVRDAVREQISSLGLSGDQARGLLRLVDLTGVDVDDDGNPDPTAVEAVVAATLEQYPRLFKIPQEDQDPEPNQEPTRMKRPQRPSAPPDAARDHKPTDYLSPEEYVSTPHKVRLTEEFQARVKKSRPHWPTKVPSSTFAIDS